MSEKTTIRVSVTTRDAVRSLADEDGFTLDEEIQQLTRTERQRRFGLALARQGDADEQRWLDMAADTVSHDAGR